MTIPILDGTRSSGMAAKNWIAGAIKHPGALRRAAAKAGESSKQYAEQHKHDKGKAGSRSRLAITLMGMKKS